MTLETLATDPLSRRRSVLAHACHPTPSGTLRAGILTSAALTLLLGSALIGLQNRYRALEAVAAAAQHDAGHDRLTGLPNRATAMTHLSSAHTTMIGLLDLDRFKDINDRYGHDVGDELLTAVAAQLAQAMTGHGLTARLGGDEFLLIWTHQPGPPIQHAETLLRNALAPLVVQGHHLHPAASLGLAVPGPHLSGPGLLAAADAAMYDAKHTGHIRLYAGDYPPPPIDRRATRATRRHRSRRWGSGPSPRSDTCPPTAPTQRSPYQMGHLQ